MPKFQATLRLKGLKGSDRATVRRDLERVLEERGIEDWRIVVIEPEVQQVRRARARRSGGSSGATTWRRETNAGGLLLVGAVAWALWFFWMLAG